MVSALLICAEYLRLGIFYRSSHRILITSFIIKLTFVVAEIGLAAAFGVCAQSNKRSTKNLSAVLEWGMYLFSFPLFPFLFILLFFLWTLRLTVDESGRLRLHGLHPLLRH